MKDELDLFPEAEKKRPERIEKKVKSEKDMTGDLFTQKPQKAPVSLNRFQKKNAEAPKPEAPKPDSPSEKAGAVPEKPDLEIQAEKPVPAAREEEKKPDAGKVDSPHIEVKAAEMPASGHHPAEKTLSHAPHASTGAHYSYRPRTLTAIGEISPGQIMQEARVHQKLSLDQVSVRTKIKKDYIDAIERDDHDTLPAPVFVTAYIKSLCDLYGILDKSGDIQKKFERTRNVRAVPDEIIQQIHENRQVNAGEARKVRRIFFLAAGILAAIAASAFFVYREFVDDKKQPSIPAPPPESPELKEFYSNQIREKFTIPQFIEIDEISLEPKAHKPQ